MTKVTLDVIYEELRRLNRRMDILEELMGDYSEGASEG